MDIKNTPESPTTQAATLPATKQRKPSNKLITRLLVLLVVLILVALSFFGGQYLFRATNDIVFSVAGKNYKKADVEKLIQFPVKSGIPKDQATAQALDYYKTLQVAEDMNISVSEEEVNTALKSVLGERDIPTTSSDPWFNLSAKAKAIKDKAAKENPGAVQGYSFVFWFGQKIEKTGDPVSGQTASQVSGFGDAELIAKDKAYAKEKADFYHQQLKDKKITPDELLAAIKADTRLTLIIKDNPTLSAHFGTNPEKSWEQEVYYKDIIDYLSNTATSGINEIKVGKTSPGYKEHPVETYYYFVQLDKGGPADTNIAERFQKSTESIKYTYYGR